MGLLSLTLVDFLREYMVSLLELRIGIELSQEFWDARDFPLLVVGH